MKRAIAVVATALVVLLAGCAGGAAPGGDASPENANGDDPGDGTLNFYVSDQPNDIDDFESLNVTIDRVGFRTENGSKVEFDVENRTVDLTELQGANATLIGSFDAPEGEYETAFLYVSAVDGDLKNGTTNVKLPSGKLQVTTPFTIGPNASVDFVFDVTVKKAGNSGKYILTPVVSESGTDVPIDTDGDGQDDRGEDADDESESDEEESDEENGDEENDDPDDDQGEGPPDDAPADDEEDDDEDTAAGVSFAVQG